MSGALNTLFGENSSQLNRLSGIPGFFYSCYLRFINIPERKIPDQVTNTVNTQLLSQQLTPGGAYTLQILNRLV